MTNLFIDPGSRRMLQSWLNALSSYSEPEVRHEAEIFVTCAVANRAAKHVTNLPKKD